MDEYPEHVLGCSALAAEGLLDRPQQVGGRSLVSLDDVAEDERRVE